MLEMQLYIKNQRVDTFKDESVTLTDSIQNVRDFEKIFTSFSQSFNLPASKTNNKILKHYYNFNIEANYAFDARIKTPAYIDLNSMPFRRGYIKLEGVDLKDNVPYSYRVTFFGDIVILKDTLGEKKLSDLTGFPQDFLYNANYVLNGLYKNPNTNDTLVPLITHSQRLYYDSGSSVHNSGNLAPGGNKHGVRWDELKPAIRVNKIIEVIEANFPEIEFTNDFFKNTDNPKFYNLFMWVCRKSGKIESLTPTDIETLVIFPTGASQNNNIESYGGEIYLNDWDYITKWEYTFTYASGGNYRVDIYDVDFQLIFSSPTVSGNLTIDENDLNLPSGENYLYAFVVAQNQINFTNVRFQGTYEEPNVVYDNLILNTGSFSTSTDFVFNFARQMPDITIVNFLSGLFRMFNLTAFVQDDGKIKVQPLDEYYNDNPTYRDITEYVGIEKSSVNAALPYREVKFEFEDTKSFLANKYGEINNKLWSLSRYNDNKNNLKGSVYKVTAPFGHFLYERLTDEQTQNLTNIQWGWSVDKSQNAILPKPLLFYPVRPAENSSDIDQIMVVTSFNSDDEAASTTTVIPSHVPMNHYARTPIEGNYFQLNFFQEISEWTGQNNFTETLFSAYRKYILSIFNPKQRITTLEVMLPLAVLLQIEMKDRIIIAGNNYKINKLTTNLSTGKSQLELINDYTIEA